MDRNSQGLSSHDQRQFEHPNPHYDPQPSPLSRQHLSRSISYPTTTADSYAAQSHENMNSSSLSLSQQREDQTQTYAGLGITLPSGTDSGTSQVLASPDSPFATQSMASRYLSGQPPTPSFPALRSSSPASSVWSASDAGNSVPVSSGFIPRLHKYILSRRE